MCSSNDGSFNSAGRNCKQPGKCEYDRVSMHGDRIFVIQHKASDNYGRTKTARVLSALAFIVVNPLDFYPDYAIELTNDNAKSLGLTDPTEAAILTTITVDKKEGCVTTNLLGPVVINSKSLRAKQTVLEDEKYGIKHLFGEKSSADAAVEVAGAA